MSGIVDLDHLMIGVGALDPAAAAFEQAGFTVTPASAMPTIGLANRCVLFTPEAPGVANYLELLHHDPMRATPFMRGLLAGADGIKSLVLGCDDVAAASARLAELGAPPTAAPVRIERRWALPSGEALDLAFTVATPALDAPPIYCNLCQHHTLAHYLRPEWRTHANGARRLVAVLAEADRPAAVEAWYARLYDGTPQVALEVAGVAGTRPRAVGFAVAVADLAATAKLLDERAVAFTTAPGVVRLAIAGVRVELREERSRRQS